MFAGASVIFGASLSVEVQRLATVNGVLASGGSMVTVLSGSCGRWM